MTQNIFVLGLDEPGYNELVTLTEAEQYTFHGILSLEDLQSGVISLADLLDRAQEQLDTFEGTIEHIAGYLDFSYSMIYHILCSSYGLPAKPQDTVVICYLTY